MDNITTPSARPSRPLLFGVGAVAATLAILFGSASSAAPADTEPAPATAQARGKIVDGKCYSQPTSKTSTIQADRFLKTEPITLTVKANVDSNCNLTYTVTAPDKGREVKSWALAYTDSYPNGLNGQQEYNDMSQSRLTASGRLSTSPIVAHNADYALGLRVIVQYEGDAAGSSDYYLYSGEMLLY